MPPQPRTRGGVGAFVRNSGYLRKWLILGVAIGVIAGLGAVVFYLLLHYAGEFLLGYLGGYHPPTAAAEGGSRGSTGFDPGAGSAGEDGVQCVDHRLRRVGGPRRTDGADLGRLRLAAREAARPL